MWTLGILIGLPVVGLLALTCLAFIVGSVYVWKTRGNSYDGPAIILVISSAGLLVVAVASAFAFYPYSAEYHRWEPQAGTVDKVSSRFLGGDNSVTQRFVVRFTDGRERSCDDTRCALIQPGDHLTLSCKRAWQYSGRDGWDCNYLGRES